MHLIHSIQRRKMSKAAIHHFNGSNCKQNTNTRSRRSFLTVAKKTWDVGEGKNVARMAKHACISKAFVVVGYHLITMLYMATKSGMINLNNEDLSHQDSSRLTSKARNETGYIRYEKIIGHVHMATTAGTEINGELAAHYERVCGHKG